MTLPSKANMTAHRDDQAAGPDVVTRRRRSGLHARWVFVIPILLACLASSAFAQSAPDAQNAVVIQAAVKYLRSQQNPDGSFGKVQTRLQTALAMLAIRSVASTGGDASLDAALLSEGASYLLSSASISGDMGDDTFKTESHAIATTALLACVDRLPDATQRESVGRQIARAVTILRQNQDRSTSSAARGGWKMEGSAGSANDRRASSWVMLSLLSGRQLGLDLRQADLDRGAKYVMGSFKSEAKKATDGDSIEIKPEDVGGFSVDETGLTVESISAMGGWLLSHGIKNPDAAKKNLAWLLRNPPSWNGPNYYYAHFFRTRAIRMLSPRPDIFDATIRRLTLQIKDHQGGDGSIGFPPGEAQNEVAMGGVFSTAMSVLILNAGNSRLPFDEDLRVKPLF